MLVPTGDFTSLVFPLLVQAARGVIVREVPLEALADSVGPRTDRRRLECCAVVPTDAIADTAAILEAAGEVGALTVVDATQAAGWLPLPFDRVDAAVCSAYKWLCCPRGTAFLVASPRVLTEFLPHAASWFAADDIHAGYYGTPLRLANDARRFDVSPAWFAWVGAVSSLGALADIGIEAIHDHDVRLADGLRAELGSADGLGDRVGRRRRPRAGALGQRASRRRPGPTAAGWRSTSTTTTTTSPWPQRPPLTIVSRVTGPQHPQRARR